MWDLGLQVACASWRLSKRSLPYLRKFRKKLRVRKHTKTLGRQARPGIEPGTSRLPALSAEPLCHSWDPVCSWRFFLVKACNYMVYRVAMVRILICRDLQMQIPWKGQVSWAKDVPQKLYASSLKFEGSDVIWKSLVWILALEFSVWLVRKVNRMLQKSRNLK